MDAFLLQPPIWELVKKSCPQGELDDVKESIGPSLVELSSDLYQEASTLLGICQTINEEVEKEILQAEIQAKLPEPPAVRERLLQEISFLIEHIHQRNQQEATRNVPTEFSRHKPSVVDYVIKTSSVSSRSSSAGSGHRPLSSVCENDGRMTHLRATPTSENGSGSSNLSERIDAVSNSINSMDIDTVVQHIRDALHEECLMRKGDIQFLQKCLEDELRYREDELSAFRNKPSLQELKDLRSSLEGEVNASLSYGTGDVTSSHKVPSSHKPHEKFPVHKVNNQKRPSTATRFRVMVQKTRTSNQDTLT